MKTKFKRISKSTLSIILAIMMLFSTMLIGSFTVNAAYVSHFYLVGDPIGKWSADASYKISDSYNSQDNKYYIEVDLTNGQYFALHNGSDQYGPATNGSVLGVGYDAQNGTYNSNAWKFSGSDGTYRVCIDESSSEWYPYVWLEAASVTNYNLTKSETHCTVGFYSDSNCSTAITSAAAGATVYVKVTPNSGYSISSVTGDNATPTKVTGSTDVYKFTMPSKAVKITATCTQNTPTTQDYRITGSANMGIAVWAGYDGATKFTNNKITLTNVTNGSQFKLMGADGKNYGANSTSNVTITSSGISNYVTAQKDYVFQFNTAGDYEVTLENKNIPPTISVKKVESTTAKYALTGSITHHGTSDTNINDTWNNYANGIKLSKIAGSSNIYSAEITLTESDVTSNGATDKTRFRIASSDSVYYAPYQDSYDITKKTSSADAYLTFKGTETGEGGGTCEDHYFFFSKAGKYTVYVKDNGSSSKPSIWVETSGGGDTGSRYVLKTQSGPATIGAAGDSFSATSTANKYEYTVDITAGTYYIYVNDTQGNPYYAGGQITINGSSAHKLSHYINGSEYVKLVITEAGPYKFTWKCTSDANSGDLWVAKAGTPVAGKVTIKTSDGSLSYTDGDTITINTATTDLATGLNASQLTYKLYNGSTLVETKTGSLDPSFTITNAASNKYSYKVVLSTSATTSGVVYSSVNSNTLNVNVSGKGVYYNKTDITNSTKNVTWSEDISGKTVTHTLENGGTYTLAISDKAGFDIEYNANFALDTASSKYVSLSTGSKPIDDGKIQTYIITPNPNTGKLTITIDARNKKISAKAAIDKSKFVDSTNTYDNTTEKVRYYFAERSGNTNHSDPTSGSGLRIAYWNNSYNLNDGTSANVAGYVDVNKAAKLDGNGKFSDSGSNAIHVNTSSFAYKPSNAGTNDTYYVYYADLPVGATSFRFVSKSNGAIPTKSALDDKTFFGSLALNPNRIYCYSSSNTSGDNYCFGIPLDKSFWKGTVANNQVVTQNFKSNIVNYAANEGGDARTYAYGSTYSEFNSILTGIWPTSYQHPLYFGYLEGAVTNSHNFKLWDNLALRGGDERRYFASVQGLAGDTLGKVAGSQYGSLRLADDSANNPLFDYKNSTTMNKIAFKGKDGKSTAEVYTEKNFPFNKSEFDGVTAYSYDSTTDYNRKFDTTKKDFVLENSYQKTRINGGMGKGLAYMPFYSDNPFEYGFGQEFEVEFYMTPTGKLVTNSNQTKDITFNFSGDDDVWVYVDGVLVLDLGGAHKISAGSINFSDMKVYYKASSIDTSEITNVNFNTVNKKYIKTVDLKKLFAAYGVDFSNTDATQKHTLQMFYMERGSLESNLSVSFNLPQSSGLTITSKVDNSKVNKGLASAAMDTANGDFFSYTLTNKLITNASELTSISNAVNALNYTGVTTPTSKYKNSVTTTDKANFPTDTLFYQSGYDVSRTYGDAIYKLNSGAKGTGSSNAYLTALNTSSYKGVSDVVYEINGSNIKNNGNEDVFKATGKTDSNGGFNLLFGQSAQFDSTVLSNTMVKVGQNNAIASVTNKDTAIQPGASTRNVDDYYSTSYEVYDNGSKKVLSTDNTSVNNPNTVYAAEVGSDSALYFANYDDTDSEQKTVTMTVTYTNTIEVGSIKIEKELSTNETTRDKFYFDVQFANVFGGSQGYTAYSNLEYDVYDAVTGAKINSAPYAYGRLGISITAGQYALIKGVPVGTKYKITERASSGYALKTAEGSITNKDGSSYGTMEAVTTNGKLTGLTGEIPSVNSTNTDDVIEANALFTNEPQALTITYRYYGRDVATGTVAHISERATTYTKTYASRNDFIKLNGTDIITYDENNIISGFNLEKLIELSSVGITPQNVIDKYTIFTSQAQAEAAMVQENKIYESGTYSADEAKWHTGPYGRPTTGSKWITYKDAEGNELTEADLNSNPQQCGNITNIDVWLYNTLRTYTFDANAAYEATDLVAWSGSALNGKNSTQLSKMFIAKVSDAYTPVTAYYNQRLGGQSSSEDQNMNGSYLEHYNLPGYINNAPTTAETIMEDENTIYYFQYWVDANGTIISTDYRYYNRITNSMTLYAVYGEEPRDTEMFGLSITENETDGFYDNKGNLRTRINTMFNPYGLPDNSDIKKTAVIFVNATNFDMSTLTPEQLETMRSDIKNILTRTGPNATGLSGNVTIETTRKANGFIYNVKSDDSVSQSSNTVTLTSKNRMQFSTSFTNTVLESKKFAVFAGMYYGGEWIVSDNCIEVDGAAIVAKNTNSAQSA